MYLLWRFSFEMSIGLVKGWSWKRPSPGIGGLDAQFQCRLFRLVQALIFGVRVGFLERLIALCELCLVGLAGFLLCDVGANHCKLRHIGWEKCGHGLTSRPGESGSEVFLNDLFV